MTDTLTGLVVAVEDSQVGSLALAERCVRIEGREASEEEDFLPHSGGGWRLAAGAGVCLLERILQGDLHNGAVIVEAGLGEFSAATAARSGLARGLERVLVLHHQGGQHRDTQLHPHVISLK